MIKFEVRKSTNDLTEDRTSYRCRLEVVSAEGTTNKIFVKRRVVSTSDLTAGDSFSAVASPTELEDYPEDAPRSGSYYFRDSTVDIVVSNADYLDEVVNAILMDIGKLADDLNALNNLNKQTTITISGINQFYQ